VAGAGHARAVGTGALASRWAVGVDRGGGPADGGLIGVQALQRHPAAAVCRVVTALRATRRRGPLIVAAGGSLAAGYARRRGGALTAAGRTRADLCTDRRASRRAARTDLGALWMGRLGADGVGGVAAHDPGRDWQRSRPLLVS